MLSGDLITYWRVLPVYFSVLRSPQRGARLEHSDSGSVQRSGGCTALPKGESRRRSRGADGVQGSSRRAMGQFVSRSETYGIRSERLPGIRSYSNGRKTIRDVASYALDIPRAILGIRRLCRGNRPDLVYVNGPRVLPLSMFFGCPIVFHSHSLLTKGYARAIVASCLRFRRVQIIAASGFVARAITGLIAEDHMRVVYSGVPDVGFVAKPVRRGAVRIGIIGRIAPEKGHLDLMQAVKMLAAQGLTIEVVIYGIPMFSAADYEARVGPRLPEFRCVSRAGSRMYRRRCMRSICWPCHPVRLKPRRESSWKPFGGDAGGCISFRRHSRTDLRWPHRSVDGTADTGITGAEYREIAGRP